LISKKDKDTHDAGEKYVKSGEISSAIIWKKTNATAIILPANFDIFIFTVKIILPNKMNKSQQRNPSKIIAVIG
jgi:hypothetical protein